MSNKLELKNISKSYFESGAKKQLFQQVNMTITGGSKICCCGKSGQGKSGLLRILARLDLPDEGQIIYNGTEYEDIDIIHWRKHIHYVSQQAIMLAGSIEQNLMLASVLHRKPFSRKLALQYMELTGMSHLNWDADAEQLSGGEKQRLALVRSLLVEPQILLLDEVTASLDEGNCRAVEQLLLQWIAQDENRAYIWISHDSEQVKRVSNEIWYFENHGVHSRKEEVAR